MKKYVLFCAVIFALCRTFAQSNAPVKLALISETDEAMPAADLLTAKLSGDDKIQLLERDQIEKVYQEQSLSAANKDYLKLGRILGADGLLLLNITRTPQTTKLTTRLIAVKPGVILADENFDWPLRGTDQWTEAAATYLDSFLPKLAVLPKDAIPISVVNLRSAISSADAAETEQQLKLLVIQRLSQEPQLFVLERQKMQLLGDEKELKADDSAFWDGSYLLEGTVDQNGYSPDTVTINARLTPPRNSVPILMEASGSRTNLTEVINQLAAKINEALKINSTIPAWTAADEAARYLEEAKWALRWGATAEAQAAADSAWALGRQDLDCAQARVKAYISIVGIHTENPEVGTIYIDSKESASEVNKDIQRVSATHLAAAFEQKTHQINYLAISSPPDPEGIDRAIRALDLYYEFSQNSPDGQSKILSKGPGWDDWHNSDWYNLGIDDLVAASKVLQNFNLAPQSQVPVKDKLMELRALTRSVAGLMANSPTVHDSYFVGDRIATYDELAYTIGGENYNHDSNIFGCEVTWGCFWQETPEDCVTLYRELMDSPVFCYIHEKFWDRQAALSRVIGWSDEDRKRAPEVWGKFVQELDGSTNVLLRMEGQAQAVINAKNDGQLESAFTTLMDNSDSNRDELVANNVDLFYLDWRIRDLLFPREGYTVTPTMDRLEDEWRTNYSPKLDGMENEYRDKTIPARKTVSEFEQQKQYLADLTPYNFQSFLKIFSSCNYTKTQAAELLPLIAPYESNLVARATSQREKFKARSDAEWIRLYLGGKVEQVLNPRASPAKQIQAPLSAIAAVATMPPPSPMNSPDTATNIVAVNKFLAIPLDGLPGDQISNVKITAHHWQEGKLLLDFQYDGFVYSFDEKGNWQQTRDVTFPAIAILDPATETWKVIGLPELDNQSENYFYHRSALCSGSLFNCEDKQIRKYDPQSQQWQVLKISDGNNYELFAVNGHLYAANENIIFEIIDGGNGTLIIASTRRQPPVSALDTQMLGKPILFEGPNHSLRVNVSNKIFTWTGTDWHEDFAAPPATFLPEIFPDGILFRQSETVNMPLSLSVLAINANAPEFRLWQRAPLPKGVHVSDFSRFSGMTAQPPRSLWQMPSKWFFSDLPAALCQSNLFLLADHFDAPGKNIANGDCDSTLLCFSPGLFLPQKLYLKFDAPGGAPPKTGINPISPPDFPTMPAVWMTAADDFLFFGWEKAKDYVQVGSAYPGGGYKPGVWLLPRSQVEPQIAAQKVNQLDQQAQAAAAANRAQKDLLAKYDLNHNGVIDPEEREAALDDPAFIESQLDVIDTNHNGLLDLEELAYFDANHDKILEPKEQAGIDIAQHLLAKRNLQKFDLDGDGFLSQQEFQLMEQAGFKMALDQSLEFGSADENHDGKIDLNELEAYMKQLTSRKLHPRGGMGNAHFMHQIQMGDGGPVADVRQLFKLEVEAYWRNPASITNRPAFNGRPPFGAFPSSGGWPPGATP